MSSSARAQESRKHNNNMKISERLITTYTASNTGSGALGFEKCVVGDARRSVENRIQLVKVAVRHAHPE